MLKFVLPILLAACSVQAQPGPQLDLAIPVEDIEAAALEPVQAKMDELVAAGATTLTLRINSYGGSVPDGQKFVQHLESIKKSGVKVVCIGDGNVMSMALYLLQSCSERLATDRTVFLAHNAASQASGNAVEQERTVHMLQVLSDALANFIGGRIKMGPEKYKARIAQMEWVFGTREALDEGVIDRVVSVEEIPGIYVLTNPTKNVMELLLGR